MYFILLIIMGLISSMAQVKVMTTFNQYSNISNRHGLTGAEVARAMLKNVGILDVTVERVGGRLSDHYDPSSKTLRLSQDVYDSASIASLGVAAHETGHAIQHHIGYGALILRSALVPVANLGSKLSFFLIFIGFLFSSSTGNTILLLGILLFSLSVIFTLITLPVEFDASKRATDLLVEQRFLDENEVQGAKKVLSAAAMTYVAAAVVAVLELLRLISIFNSRND